jgi:outer membrane protein OmpA-like peptidoglycan-associated protein/tetratricopeptide (TPR) repeat protein
MKIAPLIFSLFCQLLTANCLFSQYDPTKINKKAFSVYMQAMEKANGRDFQGSIDLLNQCISMEPKYADAFLSLGGVYGQLKNYKSSTENYEKAFAIDSNYTNEYKLPYSINLAGQGRFQEALNTINSLLNSKKISPATIRAAEYRKKTFQFAVDYAANHSNSSYQFTPVNLGDSINTSSSEYYPSITINDSLFVFTRRGVGIREDFVESTILPHHEYSKSKTISGSINEEPSKGAINISQDGDWLIFAGNFPSSGLGNFDLYISYQTPQGWSEPINLGPQINTEFWESSPSLSSDKNTLYFSSDRPGGYGGKDLYVSHHLSNGKWSEALNMGSSVNTTGDELAPFIHADNNTLYFTSDGLPGYGGSDLFVMRRKNAPDSHGDEWNAPENLGYPINTIENDGSLFIASNGVDAFYSSDRADSRGGLDLYRFELRPDIRPARTLYVRGTVFNKKNNKGIPATVELIDNATGQLSSKVQTDERGDYLITLPIGKDYVFNVNRKGYLFYRDNFLLSQRAPDSTYEKNIPLQPIEVNASIILKNIFFETNKFQLDPKSQAELDKIIQLLTENPTLKIEISGHTDNVGKPSDNLSLSNNRAKSVVTYLIGKGIVSQRLVAKGYGETKPVAGNTTEEGRAKNRRTELKVISQ